MKFHIGQKVRFNHIDYMETVRDHFHDDAIDHHSVFEVNSISERIISITYKGNYSGGIRIYDLKPASNIRRH